MWPHKITHGVKMNVFAEQTHRSQWILCGSRAHSRLMSTGGPVLILLWLKQPLQQEFHLTTPGFCPISQQALCSSRPPSPHLSHSLQAHLHLHSSITATIRIGYCIDKYAHLQLGTHTCMYFVILLIITSDDCNGVMKVGGKINLDRSCCVFQEGMSPATTTSHVPVLTPGEGLTPASPLSPASPSTPACQLIIIQTSSVSRHQNLIRHV